MKRYLPLGTRCAIFQNNYLIFTDKTVKIINILNRYYSIDNYKKNKKKTILQKIVTSFKIGWDVLILLLKNINLVLFIIGLSLIFIVYIFIKFQIFINNLKSSLYFIGSGLFTSSLILLYLDDLKLSNVKLLKYMQILSFVCIPLFSLYYMYYISYILISDTISFINDKNDINLHGHIILDKETGKSIGDGMQTIGSNIGLGAAMAGVATAVGKAVAKSSVPPIQKAGIIIGASIISGLFHSKITTVNRNKILKENINNNIVSDNNVISDLNISKFIDGNLSSSPLQDLLLNLEITNYVCISMIVLLII